MPTQTDKPQDCTSNSKDISKYNHNIATTMIDGATLKPGTPLGTHPDGLSFEQCYQLLQRLSSGSFGTVYTTQLLDTASSGDTTIYACKVIDRTQLKPASDATVMRELAILRDIRDLDQVTQLKDCFVTPTEIHIVQTYCRGGDVFEQLSKRTTYTERDARDLAAILLKVMELMHLRRLCHRDLKPENLLLVNRMQASQIVVADFGMAQYVPKDGYLTTRCGTPAFVAPEVIAGRPYDCQVDMWSIGTLLYMLLGGQPPFSSPTFQGLFRKIQAADYDFSHSSFQNVSVQAKQCLAGLLRADPYYRLTASRALEGSWFTDCPEEQLNGRDLSGSIRELKTWVAKRRFKSAVHAVRLSSHFSRFVASDRDSLFKKVQLWDAANQSAEDGSDEEEYPAAGLLSQWKGKSKNFDQLYEMQEEIATGRVSTVFKCIRKKPSSISKKLDGSGSTSPEVLAVKRVPRANSETEEAVLHEVAVMQNLSHPCLVQIKDFLEDDIYYYVVSGYIPGKTVMEHLTTMNNGHNLPTHHSSHQPVSSFTEEDARAIVEPLLQAVAYIHGEGVVHRDISLENLLLVEVDNSKESNNAGSEEDEKKKDIQIRLCDFGLARRVPAPRTVTRCCGTPLFMAPEVCKHIPYDQSADMWSVGVLIYCLLVGVPPFAASNQEQLFHHIRRGEWSFPEGATISDAAKELVRKLLVVEPMQRWTAEEALRASWFQEDASSLSSIDLSHSVSKLKDLRSKFRSVAKAVMKLTPPSHDEKGGIVMSVVDKMKQLSPVVEHHKIKKVNPLFSGDPESKEDGYPGSPPVSPTNAALGLPTCQTSSVKHIV